MALTSGYIVLVPEGRNDGSQAVYCLETPHRKTRPVGYGMTDRIARRIAWGGDQCPAPRLTPYPTGRVFLGPLPGSKLPGYLHLVLTGQNLQNL
jgi:hypothetical protein